MVLVVVLHAARVEHTKVLRSGSSWTEEEISRASVVLVPTKNATKNHLRIVEGVQPTNSKLGGLKLPKAILKGARKILLSGFFPLGGRGRNC